MRKYHLLKVTDVQNETLDSMRVSLAVPDDVQEEFRFLPGQHLPMQISLDGNLVRRTYSICSVPGEMPLQIGIRVQPGGQFSEYVASNLKAGDEIEAMPPFGQFHANIDPGHAKTYLAFAAGSGITPILSIVRATLEGEPNSNVVLFYGNRRQRTTMFIDDLYALKNRFPERLQLFFVFSQEEQEFEVFSGRLDESRVPELYEAFCKSLEPDEAFVCGPDTMIETVKSALVDIGMEESAIHVERFGAPRKGTRPAVRPAVDEEKRAVVDVIMDGHRKSFEMNAASGNLVDAAAEQGIELPYSCKGGVCATCRTHVREGEVSMATNYGLEPWEVEKGFVLACQSVPVSDRITIDYDKT
jgi:ring-1,2-phenylacetyl-CoA epoxidase subunit PaaE